MQAAEGKVNAQLQLKHVQDRQVCVCVCVVCVYVSLCVCVCVSVCFVHGAAANEACAG